MENQERQFNYTMGEGYELPSKGLIYSEKINPHVELRSMTARDEMKRLSPSSTPLKTLADIIEGCMIEKPAVHVYDMALGDYEFLLHKLRIISYGPEYKIGGIVCPHCGEEIEASANLEDLTIKEFDQAKYEELRNFVLPASGKQVTIKFQTPHINELIEAKTKEYKKRFKNAEVEFSLLATLLCLIDTVDGNVLNEMELENFINRLPAKDMIKIINNSDALNKLIGINTEITLDCSKCGGEILTFFRFGTEFFRPSNI